MTLNLDNDTSHSKRTNHVKLCKKVKPVAVVGTTFTYFYCGGLEGLLASFCVKGVASGKEQLPSKDCSASTELDKMQRLDCSRIIPKDCRVCRATPYLAMPCPFLFSQF